MLSCVAAGAVLAVMWGKTKSDGGRVTPGTTPGKLRGGRGGKPACCSPTPGGITRPISGKVMFRFGKLGNGGRPPGMGIRPGIVGVGWTDNGTLCEGVAWLDNGTVEAPVDRWLRTAVGFELTDTLERDCSKPVEAEDDTTTGMVGTTAERWTSVKPSLGGGAGSLEV